MDKFCEFALIGTTASGKTDLANKIAKETDAVILSLDSLCIYKELDIISAKPTPDEIKGIDYFGINEVFINEHFNVMNFIELYKKAKKTAIHKNTPLIITGGTSFYLKAMLDGLSADVKECDYDIDTDYTYNDITTNDPNYKVEKNDIYRLKKYQSIKDHILINNITNHDGSLLKPSQFLQNTKQPPIIKDIVIFDILLDKDILRKKIENRTAKMLKMGAIDECVTLRKKYGNCKPLFCIGSKECLEYYDGKYDYNTLMYQINTHTSQLAKRQRTFNKKFSIFDNYFTISSSDSIDFIYSTLKSKI